MCKNNFIKIEITNTYGMVLCHIVSTLVQVQWFPCSLFHLPLGEDLCRFVIVSGLHLHMLHCTQTSWSILCSYLDLKHATELDLQSP